MTLLGLLYLGLWTAVGATCGFLVCYGLSAQKKGPPYYKAWIMYATGMAFCFGLLIGIYEIDRARQLSDAYGWLGIAAMAISFFMATCSTTP